MKTLAIIAAAALASLALLALSSCGGDTTAPATPEAKATPTARQAEQKIKHDEAVAVLIQADYRDDVRVIAEACAVTPERAGNLVSSALILLWDKGIATADRELIADVWAEAYRNGWDSADCVTTGAYTIDAIVRASR